MEILAIVDVEFRNEAEVQNLNVSNAIKIMYSPVFRDLIVITNDQKTLEAALLFWIAGSTNRERLVTGHFIDVQCTR